MCYSAQVTQNYREYVRLFGADIDLKEFVRLYWERPKSKARIAKGLDAAFADADGDDARTIKSLIDTYNDDQIALIEADLVKQRDRLAAARLTLQKQVTKKASEDLRIATDKIAKGLAKLEDILRPELQPRDSRIFPGWYAPVMISEQGRHVVKPMRYQCRPAGKPEFYDTKFPGTYNARRDSLEGFWQQQFGYTHGVVMATAFYEYVRRYRPETRAPGDNDVDEKVVLEFKPSTGEPMLIACLWSRWEGPGGQELLSFAAITDDPPPEVLAAGHDRCVIPIKAKNVDAWLNPDPQNLAALYAILDDRERPYYDHRQVP
ncbi:SOS response-associated peptidase family protein [Montanilutibacter psychrotolerans]|uniref:Abasic site processing protein n=1 Tax=Montanilutibacter psychrotolerans TaxID=1327343 RepID=A0A3M8T460_9GAMM|nr:SOS response-associated peptidase family protein [Lysobacter psychrotolerans]RNF86264.1 hypothetical protein EER27_02235 [Lysobacter psychrotolerans]